MEQFSYVIWMKRLLFKQYTTRGDVSGIHLGGGHIRLMEGGGGPVSNTPQAGIPIILIGGGTE